MAPSGSELKNDGDLQQAELQRMVDGLQRCVRISYPLKVYLEDSDDANALAFPGGSIVVLKGLLGKVKSENGLSFVLAHELAHFKNRDHLRGMGRAIVFTAAAAFITGDDSNLTQLFAPTAGFSQARYSQEREEMADLQALKILGCYYGHGGGATEFFEAMEYHDRGKSKLLGHYFDSHPEALQRIDNLHRLAGELNLTFENPLPLPDVLKPSP